MKNIHNISAGAGSGKTTKLVGIITDLVSGNMGKKCSPERMILTTFTKAAAGEFKERAAAKLIEGGFLEEAVTLDAAMIGTVHSIAQTYITRYWYLCGLTPGLVPVTENVSDKMRKESLDAVATDEDVLFFREYVDKFEINSVENGRDYDFWKNILGKLYESTLLIEKDEDKVRFIDKVRSASLEMWGNLFDMSVNKDLAEIINKQATIYIECCDKDGIRPSNVTKHIKQAQALRNLLKESPDFTYGSLKAANSELDKPFGVLKAHKAEWESKVKDSFDALKPAIESFIPIEVPEIVKCIEKICDIAKVWIGNYAQMKRKEGVIDFNDMEVIFLELLKKGEVLEDIRSSIDYLFVDEFQDSNPVQIEIFKILSENVKQSWFVGDPKQSIYGFRGSDIELVNEFSSHFPDVEKDETAFAGFKRNDLGLSSEILDNSYRSHPDLVKLSNEVFKRAFKGDLPESKIILKQGRKDCDSGYPVIHHFHVHGRSNKEKTSELANGMAHVLNGTYEHLRGVKVEPSDIAVLVRSKTAVVEVASALKEKGIPVSYVDAKFKDSAEVALVLSALKLVGGKQDAKSVAELRSLIDGLGLKEVLNQVKAEKPFWGGIRDFVDSVKTLSVVDCVDAIIARFNLYDFVSCWDSADVRRANLNLVRQIARQFDSEAQVFSRASDISAFLRYVESYEPEQKFSNGDTGVKVLTYHKSKGLEWKVVFLYNLSKDMDEEVSVSDIKGVNGDILVPALPADPKWLLDAMKGNAVLNNLLENAMVKAVKEERRLLYVGLTRARDMVFTVGFGKTMPWLQQCCPTAAGIDYSIVGDGEFDIWGVGMKSCCYQCTPDTVRYNFADSKPARIRDAGFALPETALLSYAEKYHNPSKYNDKGLIAATSPEVVKEFSRIKISHSGVEDNEFGDCIHHIYALGSHPDKDRRLAAVERTLKAYGLDATNASAILDRFDDLCGYLRKEYGDPERGVEHELPFIYKDAEGRVFSGTMDMVWKTKDCCVVVDYKTFSGTREAAMKKSAEEYGSQMAIYRSAMEAAGEKVPAVLILYPVIGLIVKVN